MGELVRLPGANVTPEGGPEPSQAIIEYLEKVLDLARKGQVQAFGLAYVDEVLDIRYSFNIADVDCRNPLMAAVSYLQHEIARDSIEPVSEVEGTGDGL